MPHHPQVIFFHQASVDAGRLFFAQRAPGARVVADPAGIHYDAFGLRRARAVEFLRPAVWLCGLRALLKGHFIGVPRGDTLRMPGAFLVHGRRVLWNHRARHVGDHPNLEALAAVLRSLPESKAVQSSVPKDEAVVR